MRLPIRLRLTVWFACLLAVILVALGAFLVLRLRSDLRATIDEEVRASAATIANNYSREGLDGFREISAAALPRAGSATQVLDLGGHVLASYGGAVADRPMIASAALAGAAAGHAPLAELKLGRAQRPFRVMATAVRTARGRQVVVTAESLEDVNEAVGRILVLLLIAAPAALVTAGAVGWWLLRRALAPVERMTQKADQIGINQLGERLTTANAKDEIGHLAATLNAMLDRLEAGVETRRRLIADASHELRTPLAVMRTELDVNLRRDALPAAERELLESLREETDRMTRSVDNLLTLAQAEEGRLELLCSELDLRALVDAALLPLSGLAAAKRLELSVQGGPCVAVGDPQRLKLALTNMIDNAIKFTPPGGEVGVSCWQGADELGVSVTDTGSGIPVAAQALVFDRFYRVEQGAPAHASTVAGGLGLAICKEIASAHGGTITVRSVDGRGSTFTLTLPNAARTDLRSDRSSEPRVGAARIGYGPRSDRA